MGPRLNSQKTDEKKESFICLQQEDQSETKNTCCQQRVFVVVILVFYFTGTLVDQEKVEIRNERGQGRLRQRLINDPQFLETWLKGKQVQSKLNMFLEIQVFLFLF